MDVKKFWVRYFEKISSCAALFGVVTAIALMIAVAIVGDTRTGWAASMTRYFMPVYALFALVGSVAVTAKAFGWLRGRTPTRGSIRHEYVPGWMACAIAVVPLLLMVIAVGSWYVMLFVENVPTTEGKSGFERATEMARMVPTLLHVSVGCVGIAVFFRVTRRDADGARVLKSASV